MLYTRMGLHKDENKFKPLTVSAKSSLAPAHLFNHISCQSPLILLTLAFCQALKDTHLIVAF